MNQHWLRLRGQGRRAQEKQRKEELGGGFHIWLEL